MVASRYRRREVGFRVVEEIVRMECWKGIGGFKYRGLGSCAACCGKVAVFLYNTDIWRHYRNTHFCSSQIICGEEHNKRKSERARNLRMEYEEEDLYIASLRRFASPLQKGWIAFAPIKPTLSLP